MENEPAMLPPQLVDPTAKWRNMSYNDALYELAKHAKVEPYLLDPKFNELI